jgi:hypothetical protein
MHYNGYLEEKIDGISALQRLSQCQPKWKHHKLQRERGAGTGRWITLTHEFCSWISQGSSSCVWLYGIGTSILLQTLLEFPNVNFH